MNRQADLSPKVYKQIAQQWRDPKHQPPGCLVSLAYLGPLMSQTKEKLFPDDTYFLTDFSTWPAFLWSAIFSRLIFIGYDFYEALDICRKGLI